MGRPPIGIPILRWLGAQRYRKKQRTDLNRRKRSKQRLRQRKDIGLRQEERFSVASVISCSSLFLISPGVNLTLMQEPEGGFMGRPPIGIPILRWRRTQRYRKKQRTDLNR